MDQKQCKSYVKKSIRTMLFVCALCTIVCVCLFSATTYAWFTDSVTADNSKMVSADYSITTILSKDSQTVAPSLTTSSGMKEYSLTAGEYQISFTAQGSATTGFACIKITNDQGVVSYFTNQIAPDNTETIKITCTQDVVIKVTYQWGSHGRTENIIPSEWAIN